MGRHQLRVVLGVLWLVDAALQAEPSNFARRYPLGELAQSVMGRRRARPGRLRRMGRHRLAGRRRARPPGLADRHWRAWRVLWAVYWAGGALLHVPWVYPPVQMLSANFEEAALGQPHRLRSVTDPVAHTVVGHPLASMVALASVELALAIAALASDDDARWPLAAAIVASVAFWVLGEHFGGILAPGASDVGAGPLAAAAAMLAWPGRRGRRQPANDRPRCPVTTRQAALRGSIMERWPSPATISSATPSPAAAAALT